MTNLRVKELLKEKGVTTYQLAEHLGVTQSTVSNAINGNPSVKWLNEVADFLNVEVADLFNKKGVNSLTCPKCGTNLELTIKE